MSLSAQHYQDQHGGRKGRQKPPSETATQHGVAGSRAPIFGLRLEGCDVKRRVQDRQKKGLEWACRPSTTETSIESASVAASGRAPPADEGSADILGSLNSREWDSGSRKRVTVLALLASSHPFCCLVAAKLIRRYYRSGSILYYPLSYGMWGQNITRVLVKTWNHLHQEGELAIVKAGSEIPSCSWIKHWWHFLLLQHASNFGCNGTYFSIFTEDLAAC